MRAARARKCARLCHATCLAEISREYSSLTSDALRLLPARSPAMQRAHLVTLPLGERKQSAEGGFVALTPFQNQSGSLRKCVRNAAILSAFRRVRHFPANSPLYRQEVVVHVNGSSASGVLMFVGSVLAWNNEPDGAPMGGCRRGCRHEYGGGARGGST